MENLEIESLATTGVCEAFKAKKCNTFIMNIKKERIVSKKVKKQKTYFYNATTSTGNYFANNVLVHNSGGLGTPAHLRVECILPDTIVTLANGDAVQVDELLKIGKSTGYDLAQNAKITYVNDIDLAGVSDFETRPTKLCRVIEREADEEVYEIKTRFGEKLTVTENHLIAIMTENGISYVYAKQLKQGESVLKPRLLKLQNPKLVEAPNIQKASAANSIHLQMQAIGPDFCYWLGAMLSDGDFTAFQYASENKIQCEKVAGCFARATGFNSKVYTKGKYFFTSFNRKEVNNLIEALGLTGKIARTKEIPSQFMNLPTEQTASLLAGLFDGDGSISTGCELSYASTSKKLALQVRNLLLRFGIQTTFREQKQNRLHTLYSIRTTDAIDIQNFIEEVPCIKPNLLANGFTRINSVKSKTMKRKTIPNLFELLNQIRQELYFTQDEVIPKRIFANYYRSDPSFKKTEQILNVFKKRVTELQILALISKKAEWSQIREIAKKLHLGYRQVRKISEKHFRWNYENKSKAGLDYYRKFFSELCSKKTDYALQKIALLEKIVKGDLSFDEIISIEKKPYKGIVYDLTTETNNFFANGILTHNCGAVHRANKGVLFIDEVATLKPRAQQELLTAMQEKKYSITGQSEMSSGALVKTQAVPCEFVLVAAGNYLDLKHMHPALRSRIRGYGYEVYMDESIEDNAENRAKIAQFVAQEIKKDGKIPHFARETVLEIINEAKKRAGRQGKLTLKLRELGGLVRAAGDIAKQEGVESVSPDHLQRAKKLSQTLEQQMAGQILEQRRDYEVFSTKGAEVGKVNGLAVMGDSGIILPIVAEIAPSASREEGRIIATGKLGGIAKEAVENVSAIIKKHTGKDVFKYDIHVQFLQTYEGVEGDSASISVATAVISALEEVPIEQNVAMTGSISVRGKVLPIGGATQKAEAAISAGLKKLILPKANLQDLTLNKQQKKNIKIIPVEDLADVLKYSLKPSKKKNELIAKIKKEIK